MSKNAATKNEQVQMSDEDVNKLLAETGLPGGGSMVNSGPAGKNKDKAPGFFSTGVGEFNSVASTKQKNEGDGDEEEEEEEQEEEQENEEEEQEEQEEEEEEETEGKVKLSDEEVRKIAEGKEKGEGADNKKRVPLSKAVEDLIEEGVMVPWEGDKRPISEYKSKELKELIKANFEHQRESTKEEIAGEFFDSLHPDLQYAAKFTAHSGKDADIKSLLRALLNSQETKVLNPDNKEDQEAIVRSFLTATGFGTSDEIAEELKSIADRNELEKKAKQFKPKLDKMNEEIVESQLEQQERFRLQQIEAGKQYTTKVHAALEKGELFGTKLDIKTQNMLYEGLVNLTYPSVTGRNTNYFGHLLEKYQMREPNHPLIAEVLWHLADREGFIKKLKEKGGKEANEKAIKTLKTEQNNRKAGNYPAEEEGTVGFRKKKTLQKPERSFFTR